MVSRCQVLRFQLQLQLLALCNCYTFPFTFTLTIILLTLLTYVSASEMTYIVSGGALNSTHLFTYLVLID